MPCIVPVGPAGVDHVLLPVPDILQAFAILFVNLAFKSVLAAMADRIHIIQFMTDREPLLKRLAHLVLTGRAEMVIEEVGFGTDRQRGVRLCTAGCGMWTECHLVKHPNRSLCHGPAESEE